MSCGVMLSPCILPLIAFRIETLGPMAEESAAQFMTRVLTTQIESIIDWFGGLLCHELNQLLFLVIALRLLVVLRRPMD
jgi:hypothetical protein